MVYSVIQLENNLLKALLAFEKGIVGKKKKKEICIDSFLVENGNLKTELAAAEKQEKYLQEKNRTANEPMTLSKKEYVW